MSEAYAQKRWDAEKRGDSKKIGDAGGTSLSAHLPERAFKNSHPELFCKKGALRTPFLK